MLEYVIVDFENRQLSVVYESKERKDAEEALKRIKTSGCEIYAEVSEKLYRIICQQTTIKSEPPSCNHANKLIR